MAPASYGFDGCFGWDCVREVCLPPPTNPTFHCWSKAIAQILVPPAGNDEIESLEIKTVQQETHARLASPASEPRS
jgi:hypothetical protein